MNFLELPSGAVINLDRVMSIGIQTEHERELYRGCLVKVGGINESLQKRDVDYLHGWLKVHSLNYGEPKTLEELRK